MPFFFEPFETHAKTSDVDDDDSLDSSNTGVHRPVSREEHNSIDDILRDHGFKYEPSQNYPTEEQIRANLLEKDIERQRKARERQALVSQRHHQYAALNARSKMKEEQQKKIAKKKGGKKKSSPAAKKSSPAAKKSPPVPLLTSSSSIDSPVTRNCKVSPSTLTNVARTPSSSAYLTDPDFIQTNITKHGFSGFCGRNTPAEQTSAAVKAANHNKKKRKKKGKGEEQEDSDPIKTTEEQRTAYLNSLKESFKNFPIGKAPKKVVYFYLTGDPRVYDFESFNVDPETSCPACYKPRTECHEILFGQYCIQSAAKYFWEYGIDTHEFGVRKRFQKAYNDALNYLIFIQTGKLDVDKTKPIPDCMAKSSLPSAIAMGLWDKRRQMYLKEVLDLMYVEDVDVDSKAENSDEDAADIDPWMDRKTAAKAAVATGEDAITEEDANDDGAVQADDDEKEESSVEDSPLDEESE